MPLPLFSKSQFKTQLTVLFITSIAVVSVYFYFFSHDQHKRLYKEGFARASEAIAKYVELGLKYSIQEDFPQVSHDVIEWTKNKKVNFICLIDDKGEIDISYPEKVIYTKSQLDDFCSSKSFSDDFIVSKSEIDTKIGHYSLYIGFSTIEMRAAEAQAINTLVMRITLIILLGALLAYFLSRRITLPLVRLSRVARRVADGDTSIRADENNGGSETRELASSFNRMVQTLMESKEKFFSEMTRLNESLDDQNRELNETNESLKAIMLGTSGAICSKFFLSVASNLSSITKKRFCIITEIDENDKGQSNILSFWDGNAFRPNFSYPVESTPCKTVASGHPVFYPTGIKEYFPREGQLLHRNMDSYFAMPCFDSQNRPVGSIIIADCGPMEKDERIEFVLKIFASRVGAEIERGRIESVRARSEERFRLLTEQSSDMIIEIEAGRIIYANKAYREFSGYGPNEEIVDADSFEGVHPEDSAGFMNEIRLSILENRSCSYVFRFQRGPSQPIRWVETHGNWYINSEGKMHSVFVSRDVTDWKIITDELNQALGSIEKLKTEKSDLLASLDTDIDSWFESFSHAGNETFNTQDKAFNDELKSRIRKRIEELEERIALYRRGNQQAGQKG